MEKEGVFTLKDGVALFRQVKTGITGTTDIEILEGLSDGDWIVTAPSPNLKAGQQVRAIPAAGQR